MRWFFAKRKFNSIDFFSMGIVGVLIGEDHFYSAVVLMVVSIIISVWAESKYY